MLYPIDGSCFRRWAERPSVEGNRQKENKMKREAEKRLARTDLIAKTERRLERDANREALVELEARVKKLEVANLALFATCAWLYEGYLKAIPVMDSLLGRIKALETASES